MFESVTRRRFVAMVGVGAGTAVLSAAALADQRDPQPSASSPEPYECPECGGVVVVDEPCGPSGGKAVPRCPRCCW